MQCGRSSIRIDAGLSDVFVCPLLILAAGPRGATDRVFVFPKERFPGSGAGAHRTWKKRHELANLVLQCLRFSGRVRTTHQDVRSGRLHHQGGTRSGRPPHLGGLEGDWDEIGDAGQQHPEAFRS